MKSTSTQIYDGVSCHRNTIVITPVYQPPASLPCPIGCLLLRRHMKYRNSTVNMTVRGVAGSILLRIRYVLASNFDYDT